MKNKNNTPEFKLCKAYFDSMPYIISVIDYKGICRYISPNCEEYTGFTADEITDKKIPWIHPDDMNLFTTTVLEGIKVNSEGKDFEYRAKNKDGKIWFASTSWKKVTGKPKEFVFITRDVTWKRIKEDVLRSSEEKINQIFESTLDRIFVLDKNLYYLYANDSELRFLKKDKNHVIGQNFLKIYKNKASDINNWIQKINEIFETGDSIKFEEEIEIRNKSFTGEILLSPVKNENGTNQAVVIVHRDITERKLQEKKLKSLNEQLINSNQELEQFAYIASHDLQEPLRAISGFIQLLEKRVKNELDNDSKELIGRTVSATERMRNLIQDILSFSRLTTHAKPFSKVNLMEILTKVEQNLYFPIKDSNAKIVVNGLPEIYAEPAQMIQLFQNLIGNAIKFAKDKPPVIKISYKIDNNLKSYIFSVKDNGIGIESEYFERIFLIFQRLHTRDEFPGNGIGLAICKKIIERHNGKIWIESEINNGSTFYFTLPILLRN